MYLNDAGLQHILVDKCLTSAVIIFTLIFEVILGFLGLRNIKVLMCLI